MRQNAIGAHREGASADSPAAPPEVSAMAETAILRAPCPIKGLWKMTRKSHGYKPRCATDKRFGKWSGGGLGVPALPRLSH